MADHPASMYLDYLPAILRQEGFLGDFLLAFEAILTGLDSRGFEPGTLASDDLTRDLDGLALPVGVETTNRFIGLEQLIDSSHWFFDPDHAPDEFLPWLARWVAATLREDWSGETKRNFLGIVPLYRLRGTRAGIEAVLSLSGDPAEIVDAPNELSKEFGPRPQPQGFSFPPHFFGVVLTVLERDPQLLGRKVRRVRAIVDREKPAHTFYALRIKYPAMRINNSGKNKPGLGPGIIVGAGTGQGTTVLGTTTITNV